jgi:type 1 fimbriae regulatory protein FimB/type 1 fimbriae regulatory protein FimE
LCQPPTVNGTVTPRRKPNSETRDREHLTEAEVERLMKAAGENRYGHRDATMILIAFRYGLRPVEVRDLK